MKGATRKVFQTHNKWCLNAIALLAMLAMPGFALANGESCGDGGGGSADIETLTASFDVASEVITVAMELCSDADNKTKYRVKFDHTEPFADDSDRDGDGYDDPAGSCFTTSDDGMMYRGNNKKKTMGPGEIVVDPKKLTYTVEMSALSSNLEIGDTILVWADTQHKGIIDRAPDTDDSDGCGKPETADEYIELQLINHYAIGDTGPAGGIVFYVTEDGSQGLEAAPEDQGTAVWGCSGTLIGADGTDVGTGAQNTIDILNECATLGIAARIAADYELNGNNDWFLPSIDELSLMYTNLHLKGIGGFASTFKFYWSSTEHDSNLALFKNFGTGTQTFNSKASPPLRVRAARVF